MTYPKGTEYSGAVQDPSALLDPDLAGAAFSLHPTMLIPWPTSGNSAVVFKASIDGRPHALRFFIREDVSSRERYNTLGEFLQRHQLTDCTATAQWVDRAIRVNGQSWPMVKMEWIDGRALDAYVDALAQDENRAALQGLAAEWLRLVRRMQAVRFAHGDLQHGNVLVDSDSRLRLVDFDGCWMPASVGGPQPTEEGHPNYQLRHRPWGEWMDTFPGLLIYTALRGLAREPGLWQTYGARENILFTKDDFVQPFETPVWTDLRSLGDAGVTYGLTQLSAACGAAGGLTVPLDAVVVEEPGRNAGPTPPRPVFAPSPLRSTPWWEKTGWSATGADPGARSAGSGASTPRPPTDWSRNATHLPPPPRPPRQPNIDPRFVAAHGGPWHGPSGQAAGGSAPPPASGGVRSPAPPRAPAGRKRHPLRILIAVVLILAAMLLAMILIATVASSLSGFSSSSPDGDRSGARAPSLLLPHPASAARSGR